MESIAFTPQEREELTMFMRRAAGAIAQTWRVLGRIGERIGREWEPHGDALAVLDIAEVLASEMRDESNPDSITEEHVIKYFSDPDGWNDPAGTEQMD